MKRTPPAPPEPTFSVVQVYEYELCGHDASVERYGEPSPELLAAVVDRRERQARHSEHYRHRTPADWCEDPV